MFSFLILGLLTSSLGVMLQPLSTYYHLTDIHAALIFVSGPIGYILAAQSNSTIHSKFGQRGIAIMGPVFHVLSTLILGMYPEGFGVVLVGLSVQAVGIGLIDGSWCAWAASMERANLVSGMLHGYVRLMRLLDFQRRKSMNATCVNRYVLLTASCGMTHLLPRAPTDIYLSVQVFLGRRDARPVLSECDDGKGL